ncbi:MAG TPA: hypothetical protein VGM75_10145 [Pseudonocardiaceae bacterium]
MFRAVSTWISTSGRCRSTRPDSGDSGLGTVMNLLLLRFGIIAIGIAILAIVVFTIALTLKRKGNSTPP